jgi:hypothetical protein
MRYTEFVISALTAEGFSLADALVISVALAGYVQGIAVSLESEAEATQDSGLTAEEYMRRQEERADRIIGAGAFPMLRQLSLLPEIDCSLDDVFETGLRLFLDGVAQMLGRQCRVSTSERIARVSSAAASTDQEP